MVGPLVGLLLIVMGADKGDQSLERVGRLAAPAIREASGIVASRRHPGIFWVHNDSNNPPELFAVRRNGELVRSYRVAAPQIDWEDIATDDAGNLYLGDIGNNKLILPVRVIHRLVEPDPADPGPATRPLPVAASHYYKFSEGGRFDAEGLVVQGSRALLATKRWDGQPAEVFQLPLDKPAPLFRPATPERVGALRSCVEPVTGMTSTPDGRLVAVVGLHAVHVFTVKGDEPADPWVPIALVPHHAPDVEAITWDGLDLLLASEDRSLYRIKEKRWRSFEAGPR